MSTIRLCRIRLVVMSISEVVSLIGLSLMLEASASAGACPGHREADDCPGQQQAIELLRSRIKSDQERIRNLGAGITTPDLDQATDIAENGSKIKVLNNSLDNSFLKEHPWLEAAIVGATISLLEGFLESPEGALDTKSIAGFRLKHGLGTLGTGQTNAIIGMIREEGGLKMALIPALRSLSRISNKTSTLEYMRRLNQVASQLKAVAELGASENTLEEAEAFFALAAAVAGKGSLSVSLASALVNGAEKELQIFLLAKAISQDTHTNVAQLKALAVYSAELEGDVQTLQKILGVENCEDDSSWQKALQDERIAAAAARNLGLYNQLLKLHAQIFARFGLRACESGFYPGGCSSTHGQRGQTAQRSGASCPQFSPQNAQDALQVENSSHKDVCWGYNGKTLIATSSSTPDKANKPYISITESGVPTAASPAGPGSGGVGTKSAQSDRMNGTTDGSLQAPVSKASHSRWDTLHPFLVGRGQVSVHYYPAFEGKSYIYVAHLVTKSQMKPGSKAQLQWCSALLFNGVPFTTDTFAHNRNFAIRGECTNVDEARFEYDDGVAIDEKGRPIRTASGEKVYVAGGSIDMGFERGPFNPGTYTVVICPPFPAFSGKPPDDWGDTPIYTLVPRGNPFINPTELTCQSEDHGLHALGKEHWSGPLPPLGTFTVNLSPGMSATVTVKTY